MKASTAAMIMCGLVSACAVKNKVADGPSAIRVAMGSAIAPVPINGLDWHARDHGEYWDVWFGPDYPASREFSSEHLDRQVQRFCAIDKRSGSAMCINSLLL